MRREPDADFARYARARQHRLLRGAYLVCGDLAEAEALVVDALARLADRWQRAREDDPDASVRRILYRAAASSRAARRDLAQAAAHGSAVDAFPLEALTARQRAVLTLRWFEGRSEVETAQLLGVSGGSVRHAEAALHEVRRAAAPVAADGSRRLGEVEPGQLLERLSAAVPELDVAHRSWAVAVERRRARRRRAVAAVGLTTVVLALVVALRLTDAPRPTPGPTATTSAALRTLADGTVYAELPPEGEEGQLGEFDAGVPSVIDTAARVTRLSDLPRPLEAVAAVYLRPEGAAYRAVLVTSTGKQVLADRLRLLPVRGPDDEPDVPLGPRALGGRGRFAVFAQPGAVVRLDISTGDLTTYPVPDRNLLVAGWTVDQDLVVARSAGRAWTIDVQEPGARAVETVPTAYEGRFRLHSDQGRPGRLLVRVQDARGVTGSSSTVAAPVTQVWGETLGTQERAVAGVFFDQNLTHPVIRRGNGPIYQGLAAVDLQSGSARLLLAPESPDGRTGRVGQCCAALGWADARTVVLRSWGSHGSWLLSWNVQTGEVLRVAQVRERAATGQRTALALAVGWRY